MTERARLGPPFVRAVELAPGDVVDLGGIPWRVDDVLIGPRAEPGDPRTVWIRLDGATHARPYLEDDPVAVLTALDGRAPWTHEARDRARAAEAADREHLERSVGAAVLASWGAARDLPSARTLVFLAAVVASALAGDGASSGRVRDLAGTSDPTVQSHLRALVADGLLERSQVPGSAPPAYRYRPTATAADLADTA